MQNDNPIKSENLPGCADLTGSVAGIIAYKDTKIFDIRNGHRTFFKSPSPPFPG